MPTFLRELFELYAKRLIMKGGQGIKQIPNKDRVKLMADNLYKDFKKAGIPDEIIQTENDIKVFHHKIAEVQQENAIRAISADSAEGRKITEGLFGKPKAQVFDLKGNKIKNPQNIMGGQEIKVDIVADTIATIKSKKPIDAMKEANSVIGRKGVYKNLTPDQSKKILKDTEDHIFERDIPIDPEDMADGGVAGLLGERQNFAMGKRAFLKLMGGVGAGIAGLKSGLLGFGGKQATKKAVTETVKQTAGSGAPPAYFFKLVNKIKKLGDDATPKYGLQPREKVTSYKDYQLTEEFDSGRTTIQRFKQSEIDYYDEMLMEETYMSHTPGKGQADETMKGKTPPDDYTEDTSYIRSSGPQKGDIAETVDGVPDDIFEEVGEAVPEAIRKGKADGGRIGFAKGKGVMTLLDLVKNKFGKKSITTADKAPIPPKTLERDMFKKADNRLNDKRQMNADELEDFEMEIGGDNLEAYYFDGTVEDGARILREEKQYMDDMFMEYKKGNLNPVAGDKSPARKRFLEKKLEEMEMSGDKRLMSVDEIEELATFDLGTDMDKAINKFKQKDLKQKTELMNFDPPKNRKSNATGGLAAMLGE